MSCGGCLLHALRGRTATRCDGCGDRGARLVAAVLALPAAMGAGPMGSPPVSLRRSRSRGRAACAGAPDERRAAVVGVATQPVTATALDPTANNQL